MTTPKLLRTGINLAEDVSRRSVVIPERDIVANNNAYPTYIRYAL